MPNARRLLLLLALLLAGPAWIADARLDDGRFDELEKRAKKVMKSPGFAASKQKIVQELGRDDQLRSVDLLVDWAITSMKLVKKEYAPALEEAREDLHKFEAMLRNSLKGQPWPPKTLPKESKDAWDLKKRTLQRTKTHYEAEIDNRYAIAKAIEQTTDAEAVTYLIKKGVKRLRRSDLTEQVARSAIHAISRAERALVEPLLLKEAANKKEPASRVLALDWIGREKPDGGLELATAALSAREMVVRRAAVRCLRGLDDPGAVKPLIDALRTARGVLPLEIEAVLHYFTGNSFQGSHVVWLQWWSENGETWLASREAEARHEPARAERRSDGTYFYGLRTDSDRIVFVLDRSGSMKASASADSRNSGAGPQDAEVEGETRIEVAKNQLIWSLKHLPKDVYFNVVFYSSDVQVWKDPPQMLPATSENKAAAVAWVKEISADGSTSTFDALLKALEYADNLNEKDPTKGGCDTIFLLSDGTPTKEGGQVVVQGEELEQLWQKVKDANRIFQCVIHTVGVGRGHDSSLLRRIAAETKGTYKAVGAK